MTSIRANKNIKLSIAGKPSLETEALEKPATVGILPEKIPFIKPRLKIKVGDRVKVGSILFEDKRNPDVKFLSPGGGEVIRIDFGPRRVVKEIVIKLDEDEDFEAFDAIDEKRLESLEKDKVIAALTRGGVWPFIRSLPFRDIADPADTPHRIFVCLGAKEPFLPRPEAYLTGTTGLFNFGIRILQKLAENVEVSVAGEDLLKALTIPAARVFSGDYPVDDPGVQLYHIRKSSAENRSWYLDGQGVLQIARLFKFGAYPIERVVAVGGSHALKRKHLRTRAGIPLSHIVGDKFEDNGGTRFIAGSIFRGYAGSMETFMGFYENSLALISAGNTEEFFGFVRPGYSKPSFSRTFLSAFNTSEFDFDCSCHGEKRPCVNCGSCATVCPVDILPQFTLKCILADEIEEALSHGLLDCAECGLCTYVCPSKINLCNAFRQAKGEYYREME
ncbi:4Fe-4S dicluster domain-containing protein [Desulfobacterales bacterium HSG16]|nr:4Fe-4S dicluster domain-containing protein [Desulfobacterales bacterium HSG16]